MTGLAERCSCGTELTVRGRMRDGTGVTHCPHCDVPHCACPDCPKERQCAKDCTECRNYHAAAMRHR